MPKTKSEKQVRYLLSNGSPLTDAQRAKLKAELHSGAVRIGHEGARRKPGK